MRALLRENLAIVIGVSLPVVVVILFMLATYLPPLFVDPPRHDLLLTTRENPRYGRPVRVEIDIVDGRLRVRAFKADSSPQGFTPVPLVPRLFVWSHEASSLREIELRLPDDVDELDDGAEIAVPELAGRTISTLRRAPDGYELGSPRGGGSGIFGLLFGGGAAPRLIVEKDGAKVPIRLPDESPYWGFDFFGWVVD